jgi:long-chain acyl-CoA synthetase
VRHHPAYGLTESTSPLTLTPLGAEGRVDPASGALSVGVPVYDSRVEILGDDGAALPPGEIGEIVATGPQVVPGYWRKPDETAIALPDGRLRTGDVGYVDGDGWVYLVDRRKDLIIASGYKVWPREVEDVLYTHPAVREAAVVGVADAYRGETVKAYVSLKAGAEVTVQELVAHCKQRMAAYKYPREVEVVDELPKSPTGKILRRSLRARAATEA